MHTPIDGALAAWRVAPGLLSFPAEDGCVVYEPSGGDTHLLSSLGEWVLVQLEALDAPVSDPSLTSSGAATPRDLSLQSVLATLADLAQAELIQPRSCASAL